MIILSPGARHLPLEAPLQERMRSPRRPESLALVIFGATGDLTRRKLMPALYRLFREDLLPESFVVVGLAREEYSSDEFRERMRAAIEEFVGAPDREQWERFAAQLQYVGAEFGDPGGFARLAEQLETADQEVGTAGNRLYYLAVPPTAVSEIAEQLSRAQLVQDPTGPSWSRIIVEKPFGRDLATARELNAALRHIFDESQLYRIDHYLGKETVQNLFVFRFANVIWEPVWNRNYIDHVQITVGETVGVERRAGYYERAGALRDMVQSHLLQLLAVVAMEPPTSYDPDSIRSERIKVLRALRSIHPERVSVEAVRGQYSAGVVEGVAVPGYREEPGVARISATETYAAVRLWVDNWRWSGVPFYLRTGKRLPQKATEITVRFRPAPHPILDTVEGDCPEPNQLVVRIQPGEGISLFFEAKVPGLRGPLHPVSMDFSYQTSFSTPSPNAYERLLLDAMLGDATLFSRCDEVEASWALVTPVLEAWEAEGEPEPYPAGSWGPPAADDLLASDGREWREP
ncbi:MAG TPA: glucose-6-phosphate dehydrogenase [Longimicrobiaceae bacterium]|nr:glucose-6-phosphate dehydrogenase [Longimicrobiaceae bacterium]